MSAFVVGTPHIDYLLTAGMSRQILRLHGHKLRWFATEPPRDAEIGWVEENRRELTPATAGQVGAMLLAENQRSVNHRYAEEWIEEPYLWREVQGPFDPVVVLKAIECYAYQACEHDEWPVSEAKQFIDSLLHTAIGALPGYDNAPGWEITEVQYETGISLLDLRRRSQ